MYEPDWDAIIESQEQNQNSVTDREFVLAEAINDLNHAGIYKGQLMLY